jgi:non-specific serine/threonine protein kinase/serine/threonine-protein kinase
MHTDLWARVVDLFGQACDLPPADRAAWLASACGDDDALRRSVWSLLEAYETDPGFLEQPVDATTLDDPALDPLVGRTLGHYRIVRRIGRGGMAVVYEAARDDREFDRRAAIKILPIWNAALLSERFKLERRLLAGLDHESIARLIDAGVAGDGTQYFVMEFVDGVPIDEFCRAHALSLRERIALVARVLDAIAYAHHHLVVHRDVKPANILVTPAGQSKLLDFGIAAMISNDDGTSSGATRTGYQRFTPEFASPEQVRGERISTASDVYSMGALAYLLLTGRRPYSLEGRGPIDAMRTICDVDPPLMSTVADTAARRLLAGDLDNVIAKALRKPATERYASATEFAADLRAWLDSRPVTATPQTLLYRARRFASRNTIGVAAAAAVTVAVLGGAAATAWQARIARQERDRAQNRFKQVREFSRSLLFDVHDALRPLPGSTAPRKILLDRAVQFLDGLAADAGDDDELMEELAEGYRRLGAVLGTASTDNLGQVGSALASLDKAAGFAERALAAQPADVNRLIGAIDIYAQLDEARRLQGDRDGGDRARARHLVLVDALARAHPDDAVAMRHVASGYSDQGIARAAKGESAEAKRFYLLAIQSYDKLPAAERETESWARAYSLTLKRLGAVEMVAGAFDDSERHYRAALAIEESWVPRGAGNIRWPFELTYSLSDLGLLRSKRGDDAGAIELWTRGLDARRQALAADPKNTRILRSVATLESRLGGAYGRLQQPEPAVAFFRHAIDHYLTLPDEQRQLPDTVTLIASIRVDLASVLIDLASANTARRSAHLADAKKQLDATELAAVMSGGKSADPALSARVAEVRGRMSK